MEFKIGDRVKFKDLDIKIDTYVPRYGGNNPHRKDGSIKVDVDNYNKNGCVVMGLWEGFIEVEYICEDGREVCLAFKPELLTLMARKEFDYKALNKHLSNISGLSKLIKNIKL